MAEKGNQQGLYRADEQPFRIQSEVQQRGFQEIDRYFKDKNYEEWSLEDAQAPSCCEKYRDIAIMMDQEFTESKYAKPGKMINTKSIVRLD